MTFEKKKSFIFCVVGVAFFLIGEAHSIAAQSVPYTPQKGSVERKAIFDGVRKYRQNPQEIYSPRDFKVQNGWAFISADDPAEPGVDSAGFYVLLHKQGKNWKVVDEVNMTEGSDFAKEIKRIRKKFPKSPSRIFL